MRYIVGVFDFTPAVSYLERLAYHTLDYVEILNSEEEREYERIEDYEVWLYLFENVLSDKGFYEIKNGITGFLESYQGDHDNVVSMLANTGERTIDNITQKFITICFNVTGSTGIDLKQVAGISVLRLEFYNHKAVLCLRFTIES